MRRPAQTAALAAALLALAGCADRDAPQRADEPPATQERPAPSLPEDPGTPAPDPANPLGLTVPEGVPTEADGQPADPDDLAVVERWLAALTQGDIPAAAATFADGSIVQNLLPPERLADRAARLAFNEGFPCGAEIADASSVDGYLVVTYRLTDRVDSPCDGPGGRAAGTIKVEGGKMTEWYRLPDPPQDPSAPAAPEI